MVNSLTKRSLNLGIVLGQIRRLYCVRINFIFYILFFDKTVIIIEIYDIVKMDISQEVIKSQKGQI